MTDKGFTRAYEIIADNLNVKTDGEFLRGIDGQAHMAHPSKTIELLVKNDLTKIKFDKKTESQLARYNLEQENRTLVSEIEFHRNKLFDIKKEFERFNKVLDEIKRIGKDMIDGHEYERTDDCDDEEGR